MAHIVGADALQAKFRKLAKKLKNKKGMYKRIGVKLMNEISYTFKKESHEGDPWKPLSQRTIDKRRRGDKKSKARPRILHDTGTLRRFVRHATPSRLTVGSPIEYAPKHEFGEGVPERPMLPSKEMALKISVEVTDKYISQQLKKAGLK